MSSLFRQQRSIADATKIPLLGWRDRIYLVRTDGASLSALKGAGAKIDDEHRLYIERDRLALLDALDRYLPHFAREKLTPNVVDLIPDTSWCSSLANMLTSTAWKSVRESCVAIAGGCEDCGEPEGLECHEMWTYDEERFIQKLIGLRSLCEACHETYHLGYATVQGRYSVAFERLAVMNRIEKGELGLFEEEIFAKYQRRSGVEWDLDLSILKGRKLSLKTSYQKVAPTTIVGRTRLGETEVNILGVDIVEAGKGFRLV